MNTIEIGNKDNIRKRIKELYETLFLAIDLSDEISISEIKMEINTLLKKYERL
jgi:hypothetical protein